LRELRLRTSLSQREIRKNFEGVDLFSDLMKGLDEIRQRPEDGVQLKRTKVRLTARPCLRGSRRHRRLAAGKRTAIIGIRRSATAEGDRPSSR